MGKDGPDLVIFLLMSTVLRLMNKHFRPMILLGLSILALFLGYLYINNNFSTDGGTSPSDHQQNVEQIDMKESDIQDMDEIEHLYLEQ